MGCSGAWSSLHYFGPNIDWNKSEPKPEKDEEEQQANDGERIDASARWRTKKMSSDKRGGGEFTIGRPSLGVDTETICLLN